MYSNTAGIESLYSLSDGPTTDPGTKLPSKFRERIRYQVRKPTLFQRFL